MKWENGKIVQLWNGANQSFTVAHNIIIILPCLEKSRNISSKASYNFLVAIYFDDKTKTHWLN